MNGTDTAASRAPSLAYLTTSFILLATMQVYNVCLTSVLIITIIAHRPLHTIPNLLTANSSFAIFYYSVIFIAQLAVGLKASDDIQDDTVCIFLSYLTVIGADAICYSYLVTATSQYFFNILYRQKYLLTNAVHWLIIIISWILSVILPLLLYLPGLLKYSIEMHLCTMEISMNWTILVYMALGVGTPLFGITIIYFSIVRYTRRTHVINFAISHSRTISNRDLRVIRHMMTLFAIFTTASLPGMIVLIWNHFFAQSAPIQLYLFSALMISFYKSWLFPQYHDEKHERIKKPDELERDIPDPPSIIDSTLLDRIQGSMIGMALGDALGAYVEFKPPEYLLVHPVTDLQGGGTWGLKKGQFTDDTSMALCLGTSLIMHGDFIPYDQLVRYKWWYQNGYLSSTGKCFDIGMATADSLNEFERRQKDFAQQRQIPLDKIDHLSDSQLLKQFKVYCSRADVAGNGALMRLAPVPLFFHQQPISAVEYSGISGRITHGDRKAFDACRYYGALIVAALHGESKESLLSDSFYSNHKTWFGNRPLHESIAIVSRGSFKRAGGFRSGIRGKGYIVSALEAALWAFWSDENSFEKGALAAVNLGDDTDTTAAIYGQLAGAYYSYKNLPKKWIDHLYAKKFIESISRWLLYEGDQWNTKHASHSNQTEIKSKL